MKEPIAKDQNYEKIRTLWRKIRLNQRGRLSARYKAYLAAAANDPAMAEKVADRLDLIGKLERKYGPSLEDVIAFGENAKKRELLRFIFQNIAGLAV